MNELEKKRVSVVGCGWLGLPLAVRLLAEGHAVKGSTTSPEKIARLRRANLEGYVASLIPKPQGAHWPELLDTDFLIVDIPPRLTKQGGDFHPQQLRNLAAMLLNSPVTEIIYVSSTSVYPELNRNITEEDVIVPAQSASPYLVEAEQIMTSLRTESRKVAVLRCGGLMGYDRIPGKYVRGKQNMTTGQVPVNYIHRDDVVGIISGLVARGVPDKTYNAVAPGHPRRRVVYESTCKQFGWEPPTFAESAPPEAFKIVASDKLINDLSYDFLYPDPVTFHYELPDSHQDT